MRTFQQLNPSRISDYSSFLCAMWSVVGCAVVLLCCASLGDGAPLSGLEYGGLLVVLANGLFTTLFAFASTMVREISHIDYVLRARLSWIDKDSVDASFHHLLGHPFLPNPCLTNLAMCVGVCVIGVPVDPP